MARSVPVRLSGMDVFHVRLHQEMRFRGQAGNSGSWVLELDGRTDDGQLRERVGRAEQLLPELRWRLGRDRRLQPAWRVGAPSKEERVSIRSLRDDESPLDATTAWLDQPAEAERTWQLRVLRGERSDAVVLRWHHALTDARGGQRLLAWLGGGQGPLPAPPSKERRFVSVDSRLRAIARAERWSLLRAYRDHVLGIAQGEIASLDSATERRRPGRTRAVRLCLDEERTAAFDRTLRRRAGVNESGLLAYAAAQLVDGALALHGVAPEQHTVVVPVSLDGGRHAGRMFGNHLTMMMLRLGRDELLDRDRALRSLAAQRREIVRQRLDIAFLVALEAARYMPAPIYSWFSRRPFGGERMSVLVTHPGTWSIDDFLGVPVRDAYPLPTAVLPPGLQVVGSRHGKRLSLAVVFVDSVIAEDQVRALLPHLEAAVLAAG